jgi:hypothetical protein
MLSSRASGALFQVLESCTGTRPATAQRRSIFRSAHEIYERSRSTLRADCAGRVDAHVSRTAHPQRRRRCSPPDHCSLYFKSANSRVSERTPWEVTYLGLARTARSRSASFSGSQGCVQLPAHALSSASYALSLISWVTQHTCTYVAMPCPSVKLRSPSGLRL